MAVKDEYISLLPFSLAEGVYACIDYTHQPMAMSVTCGTFSW